MSDELLGKVATFGVALGIAGGLLFLMSVDALKILGGSFAGIGGLLIFSATVLIHREK